MRERREEAGRKADIGRGKSADVEGRTGIGAEEGGDGSGVAGDMGSLGRGGSRSLCLQRTSGRYAGAHQRCCSLHGAFCSGAVGGDRWRSGAAGAMAAVELEFQKLTASCMLF